MKIAIDCRYIGKSGIGTYSLNMVRSISRYNEHYLLLLVTEPIPELLALPNVCQKVCGMAPFSLRELFCFDWSEVNNCDVFLSPYFNLSLGIKIPTYITIHDVIFMDLPYLVSKTGYWFRKYYLKWAIWRSEVIFTVSGFSRKQIISHFGNKKPIVVVSNVVADKIKISPAVNLEKEDYFIFVGNVKRHKGLSTLLEAFKKAKKEGLTSTLKIVGETESFRTKDAEIASKLEGLSDVEFTGRVSDEDLITLISKARALVQPSLYEGFGIPPMEALYLGTHAIISDIEPLREIYQNLPVSFFKVKNSDDLCELLLHADCTSIDIVRVRQIIDSMYDMDNTAKIIIKELCSLNDIERS